MPASYVSLHGPKSKRMKRTCWVELWALPMEWCKLDSVFFLAISLPMCSNWLFRLTPKNMSLTSGYTLISTKINQYFHSNAQVLRLFFNLSNDDSGSPKHLPDPARTRKLRKCEHTLKTNGDDSLTGPS